MQNGNTHHYLSEDTYKNTRLPTEQATSLIPNAYTEKEFFDLEQKQVFGRNWVCVGAASQVRDSGNIIVAEVGGQSLIITRDEDGELRAFYNVCRHRGTRLCEKDGKVNKHIVCPYHGWGYNLRGDCVGTPLFDKGENRRAIQMHDMSHLESFDKKDYGLFPVRVFVSVFTQIMMGIAVLHFSFPQKIYRFILSTPWEGTVRYRMEFAIGITRQAKRFQQSGFFTLQFLGDQGTNTDHFIAVIGIGDDIGVFQWAVKNRKTIRRKTTDAAGRVLAIKRPSIGKTRLTMCQCRHPHFGKIFTTINSGDFSP